MRFYLYDLQQIEASQRLSFAGNRIDTASEKRNINASAEALQHDNAQTMLLSSGHVFIKRGQNGSANCWFSIEEARALNCDTKSAIVLGTYDQQTRMAMVSSLKPEELFAPITAVTYRSAFTQQILSHEDLGALAEAAALDSWNRSHRFCSRCGAATRMVSGGFKRVCRHCNGEHFPRTDPVAIMLPVRGDRCILARSPHFAENVYSCLAGFIEPGETIETAVRRESKEEMGLEIGRVGYHASQPWPFPYSLMIGCHAEVLSDEFTIDRDELEDGRWFDKQEVKMMLSGNHPQGLTCPSTGAIASHLIQIWAQSI